MKNNRKGLAELRGNNTTMVFTITLVLLILGLLMLLEYHAQRQSFRAQEQLTYKVDLTPNVDDEIAKKLTDSIAALPYVRKAEYISKEEAAEIFSNEIGEDFVSFIGYNPLSPTIMVNFWANWDPDHSSQIIDQFCHNIKQLDIVTGVAYQEHVANSVMSLFRKLTLFMVFFGLLLLVICYITIRNTIRISLSSQRESIQTMRMVGATNGFITRPYLWRSALFGAMGGIFANMLLFTIFYIFNHEFSTALLHPHHFSRYAVIAIILVVIGITVSLISTAAAVHRYLRLKE
ncbi:MAG: permease-like cell division protein FtsX [Bacteroidales bacterium]|nr:permease-like cell division protein FtsX [Bacteroidales bacterium]